MSVRLSFLAPSLLAGLLVGSAFPTQAQTRILFVGNSFTHGKFAPRAQL